MRTGEGDGMGASSDGPSPRLSDAVVRLDDSFRRLRRWMSKPPAGTHLEGLRHTFEHAGSIEAIEADPAKVAACEAIVAMHHDGPVVVGQVADYLSLERSTASRLLSDCEKQDLIARDHDPHDRRRVLVTVTPRGALLAEQTARVRRRLMAEMVADWSEEELEAFLVRFAELSERIGRVVGDVVAGRVPPELVRALQAVPNQLSHGTEGTEGTQGTQSP